VIVQGLDADVQVYPPGLVVAVYWVIADPPVEAGAVQDTASWVLPGVRATPVGAPGIVDGVPVAPAEAGPAPLAFVAVTVTVYAVPLVSPVIVQGLDADVQVNPPGLVVAVYWVIVDPPVEAGAVHDTASWVLPGVRATPVGAPGIVDGVAVAPADAGPLPTVFAAVTVTV
jgi:anti-sigma factor ChrR (cupin superfamily)